MATTGQQPAAGRLSLSQRVGSTRLLHTDKDPNGVVTSRVRRTVLPGGLRVISEEMTGVRSASIGVWVGVGSRHESPRQHGCSHFLEHVLFKGTSERTSLEISESLDRVGGEFNAFTTKEYTCFHARVLGKDVPIAVDVLGDMLTNSTIASADIEAERHIILDEIAMHDDDPDDVVHNLFAATAWGDSPLGRPIAGTAESIADLTRDRVARYYRRHYRPTSMVVAAAGNVDHTALVKLVRKSFGRNGFLSQPGHPMVPPTSTVTRPVLGGEATATRPFEQVNLVTGYNGITRTDPRRFALNIVTTVVGGGTSSRLFQQVREQRGLAYSVYAFAAHHSDAGLVGVSAGCLPHRLDDVRATIDDVLDDVRRNGITRAEFERARGQLVGSVILNTEDADSKMARLGKAELLTGELVPLDDLVKAINDVTWDEVNTLAEDVWSGPQVVAQVGP